MRSCRARRCPRGPRARRRSGTTSTERRAETAVFLALLAARLARRLAAARARPFARVPVNVGHVAAALFASAPVLFYATSLPYTEGLAFAVCLGALLFADLAATAAAPPRMALFAALAG